MGPQGKAQEEGGHGVGWGGQAYCQDGLGRWGVDSDGIGRLRLVRVKWGGSDSVELVLGGRQSIELRWKV